VLCQLKGYGICGDPVHSCENGPKSPFLSAEGLRAANAERSRKCIVLSLCSKIGPLDRAQCRISEYAQDDAALSKPGRTSNLLGTHK